MVVVKFKDFLIDELTLSVPVKENKVYVSKINCPNIQIPAIDILNENTLSFEVIQRALLLSFLEDIERKIVTTIANNSVDFFKGKEFTLDRIKNSISKVVSVTETKAYINNATVCENCILIDMFNEKISPDFPIHNAVCILNFDTVVFDKKSITVFITVSGIKVKYPKKSPASDVCFLDEDPEPEQLQQPEIKTITIRKDPDDLDFFD